MDHHDNLLGVFQTIYRWRKTIRNVCLLALAGSIAGTLLLDTYYQATTIFYPASPQLANPELMFGNTGQVTDYYGSDRDLDRIAHYCEKDVLATVQLFLRLRRMPILVEDQIIHVPRE